MRSFYLRYVEILHCESYVEHSQAKAGGKTIGILCVCAFHHLSSHIKWRVKSRLARWTRREVYDTYIQRFSREVLREEITR